MPQNLEIKLACAPDDLASIAGRLHGRILNARSCIEQIDTYFNALHGRLKLRQITDDHGHSAELIQYSRPTVAGARTSTYHRIAISPERETDLLAALSTSLGIVAVVRKRRTVAIWRATRIHLDEVDLLGQFVELETVIADAGGDAAAREEFAEVMQWLQLGELNAIPGSYCDLMIATRAT